MKLVIAIGLLVGGCGGSVATERGDGSGGQHPGAGCGDDCGLEDAASSLDDAADALHSEDAGNWDPCLVPTPGAFSCCSGEPCRGYCSNGVCKCGGIAGGCSAPTVCCGLACTVETLCG